MNKAVAGLAEIAGTAIVVAPATISLTGGSGKGIEGEENVFLLLDLIEKVKNSRT